MTSKFSLFVVGLLLVFGPTMNNAPTAEAFVMKYSLKVLDTLTDVLDRLLDKYSKIKNETVGKVFPIIPGSLFENDDSPVELEINNSEDGLTFKLPLPDDNKNLLHIIPPTDDSDFNEDEEKYSSFTLFFDIRALWDKLQAWINLHLTSTAPQY